MNFKQLTKHRVWTGAGNPGEVAGKIGVVLTRFVCIYFSCLSLPISGDKMAFPPSWFREGTYHMRILSLAFRKKKEGQSDLFTYAGSLGTVTQIINMPKWHHLGWRAQNPLWDLRSFQHTFHATARPDIFFFSQVSSFFLSPVFFPPFINLCICKPLLRD